MSNNIPKLRFPVFTGEWEEKKLGEVCEVKKGQQINNSELTKDTSLFPMLNGGSTISGYYIKSNSPANTITISEGGNSCGFVSFMKVDFWAGGHCYVINHKTNITNHFLFQSLKYKENDIMRLRVGSGLPNIQKNSLLCEISISLPSLPEQEKIAEFLTEMDNLIAAQGEKVEALKEKKKGLMQQLFPQNGETTPRLRFPGFEGKWREKKLGEVGNTISGLTYSPSNVSNNGLLVLRSSNIKNGTLCFDDCVYVQSIKKYNPVKENDILICVRNGSTNLIGKNALIPRGLSSAFGAFMMVFRSTAWSFVFQLLRTERYSEQIEQNLGARINSINSEDFKNYTFLFPPTTVEQQKIASFLSELDNLIAAESDKLENLKNYKKGLMQQLFPQPVK